MPHLDLTTIDIKALAREIRAAGITVAQHSYTIENEELSEASQALANIAERLEKWRLYQADALRREALAIATQRAALDGFERKDGPEMTPCEKALFHKIASIAEGAPAQLGEIAQQLDPLENSEALTSGHSEASDPKKQVLEVLSGLVNSLPDTPQMKPVANALDEAMDTIDGYGRWPGPDDLPEDFRHHVAIWQYKGNLRGGIVIIEESTGEIHPMVADYSDLETMYSGGLYASWAAAYAAIGMALDLRK